MADNYPTTGTIRATPQQPTLGAIARALSGVHEFAARPFGYANPPGEMLSELVGIPAAQRTVERLSYGEPLTTGAGGLGGTTRLKDDTVETLMNVTPLGILAGKGVVKGAKALEDATVGAVQRGRIRAAAAKVPQDTAYDPLRQRMEASGNLMYAVKPKGGNWTPGSVEAATRFMRIDNAPALSGDMINEAAGRDIFSEYRKAYDKDMSLSLHEWTRKNYPEVYAQLQGPEAVAADKFINTKLDKYIRNEMGTPEDPVRALAERGIVHQEQTPLAMYSLTGRKNISEIERAREAAGFPAEGLAQTRAGREWEAAADNALQSVPAETYQNFGSSNLGLDWVNKLDPQTPFYQIDPYAPSNMFSHLIDELKFSMDPNSGLPANLRFDPKDIDKLTVPQAVERVAKINAWRAEEAAKAERAGMMENLQATPRMADDSFQLSFVDKPGGAWVDIPETVDEKGMKLCTSIGKAGGWCTQAEWAAKSYGSGENRLTALVDTEGRPHVQAKITQDVDHMAAVEDATMYMTPEQELAYERHFQKLDRPPELEESLAWLEENAPDAYAVYQEVLNSQPKSPPSITELKPVENTFTSARAQEYAKRDPDYFRKVENSVLKFLNSGEWGRVKDLHHYGIVDLKEPNSLMDAMNTLYGDESNRRIGQEFIDAFNHAVSVEPNAPRFMTQRQLRDFIGPVEPLEGYAGGGIVKGAVKSIGELVQKYIAKEAPEAAVTAAPKEQKMLQGFYRGYAGDYDAARAAAQDSGVFVSPQRAVGEYYANKRAAQTGLDPHLEMILADPFAGRGYGHSTMGTGKNPPMITRARELAPEDVKDRTKLYADGGAVDAEEAYTPEERQLLDFYKMANRRNMGGTEASVVGTGANANLGAAGNVNAGVELNRMSRMNAGLPEDTYGGAYRLTYGNRLGDVDVNATVLKPIDAEKVYIGMLNGSIPVGLGRLLLGLQGVKTPAGTDVTGHTLGWAGRVGPGFLSANVMKPRSGRASGQVEYQIPFAEGGAVNYDPAEIEELARSIVPGYAAGGLVHYDPTEIDTIVSRVKEELHG